MAAQSEVAPVGMLVYAEGDVAEPVAPEYGDSSAYVLVRYGGARALLIASANTVELDSVPEPDAGDQPSAGAEPVTRIATFTRADLAGGLVIRVINLVYAGGEFSERDVPAVYRMSA